MKVWINVDKKWGLRKGSLEHVAYTSRRYATIVKKMGEKTSCFKLEKIKEKGGEVR